MALFYQLSKVFGVVHSFRICHYMGGEGVNSQSVHILDIHYKERATPYQHKVLC